MMRRQSSDENQYDDIVDEPSHQTLQPHDFPARKSDEFHVHHDIPSDSPSSSSRAINNNAGNGWNESNRVDRNDDDEDDERVVGSANNSASEKQQSSCNNSYAPWNDQSNYTPPPPASSSSISVRMSIWRELSSSHPADDECQGWRNNAVTWRRSPYAVVDDEDSALWPTAAGVGEDGRGTLGVAEQEHEERRILERFASFPKGRAAVMLMNGDVGSGGNGGGGGGSGSSTPKSGRRRNKRKGCDSPRPPPDDSSTKDVPVRPPLDHVDVIASDSNEPPETITNGQGHGRSQLSFDLMRLQNNDDDSNHHGNEPLTSHGMRPARGWASLDIFSDADDEGVTVSPRVLSPEMDEPAGSFHVRNFSGRSVKEPQEKRTTFIALGSLNHERSVIGNSNGRAVVPTDECPAAVRAKQLVQQIYSLKEKVKLYEDAFEQRYGYRPSHHQKMDDRTTKRFLTELARTRKELKQLKERYHLSEPADVAMMEVAEGSRTIDQQPEAITTTTTGFLSGGDGYERKSAPCLASVEQTVLEVQEHLAGNRQLAGRSEVVEELSAKEVLDEKLAVQRALLYVESLHGRPASYGHKDLLRPLYDRYRLLKRMVVRSGLSRSKEEICDLAPILEYETLELGETWSTTGLHRHSAPPTPSLESMEELVEPRPSVARRHLTTPITGTDLRKESCLLSRWSNHETTQCQAGEQCGKRQRFSLNIEENLHALPLNQLVEQMRHVREEKRRLRRAIRDLEADLLRQSTTNAASSARQTCPSSVDDGHCSLEPVYAQYRHARAKLRLLEALVAKHDGSATL